MDTRKTPVPWKQLLKYTPPKWAEKLNFCPEWRIHLAMPDTPIEEWDLPGLNADATVFIKRDDMTGCTTSGNKIRKLEFLLADAMSQGCNHVITMGGIHSNHCRAVAVACKQLGLEPHLFFLSDDITTAQDVPKHGNMMLNILCGAHLYFARRNGPYFQGLQPFVDQTMKEIQTKGEKVYYIPGGGSDKIGFFGYVEAFRELLAQRLHERFDDIVVSTGSCGTAASLAISNYLTGSKLKIHAVLVFDGLEYAHAHVNNTLKEFGITNVMSHDIIDVIDGFHGAGYGKSTKEEQTLLYGIAARTGIILDPVYTIKGVKGMIETLNKHPDRFKGSRVLFIHTGGAFGNNEESLGHFVKGQEYCDRVHFWTKE